jgi:hypothetical protein
MPGLKPLLQEVMCHFVVSRAIFLGTFLVATIMFAPIGAQNQISRFDPIALPRLAAMRGIVEGTATSYGDFGWYSKIANDGYDAAPFTRHSGIQHDWCYFPAQAWLIPLVRGATFRFVLAMLLGLAGSLMTCVVMTQMFGLDVARRAMPYLLYFPFSYALTQFRPETLLFFFFALALLMRGPLATWRGSLAVSLVALLAAGFCKPNGFLLAIFWSPEALVALRTRRPSAGLFAAAAPCLGIVVMSVWMYALTGAPLAWAQGQWAWGAELIGTPLRQINTLFSQPMLVDRYGWDPILLDWLVWAGMWVSVVLLAVHRQFLAAIFLLATSLVSFVNFGVWVQGKHLVTVFAYFAGLAYVRLPHAVHAGAIAVLAALLASAGLLAGAGFHSFAL